MESCNVEESFFIPGEVYGEVTDRITCGGASILTARGYAPLKCGRWWECDPCLKHRVQNWSTRLAQAMMKYCGNWRMKKTPYQKRRSVQRSLSVYVSFPIDGGVVFLSPEFTPLESEPLPSNLENCMHKWVQTPRNKRVRISTSRGMLCQEERPKQETYIVSAHTKRISKEVASAGGIALEDDDGNGEYIGIGLHQLVKRLEDAGIAVRRLNVDDRDSTTNSDMSLSATPPPERIYEMQFLTAEIVQTSA